MLGSLGLNNLLVRLFGWYGTLFHGDPTMFDRWMWLRRHVLPGRLRTLDAGSGSGMWCLFAARRGNEVLGISFDSRNNDTARERARILGVEGVEFRTGDLRELATYAHELGTFDQIICCETIEHLLDDEALVTGLAQLLRPGGRLLLTTPNVEHRPFYGENVSTVEDGGHVRYGYSHEDLQRLIAAAGLEVLLLDGISGPVSQTFMRVQARLGAIHALLGWAAVAPLRALQVIDVVAKRVSSLPPYSVAVVAVKRTADAQHDSSRAAA